MAHALRQRGANLSSIVGTFPGRSWVEVLEKTLAECRALAVSSGRTAWAAGNSGRRSSASIVRPGYGLLRDPGSARWGRSSPSIPAGQYLVDLRNGESPDAIEILGSAARGEPPGHDAQSRLADARSGVFPIVACSRSARRTSVLLRRQSFTEKLVEAVEGRTFVAVVGCIGQRQSLVVVPA